jgi:hypothetical protein
MASNSMECMGKFIPHSQSGPVVEACLAGHVQLWRKETIVWRKNTNGIEEEMNVFIQLFSLHPLSN